MQRKLPVLPTEDIELNHDGDPFAVFERWFADRSVGLVVMEACGSAHHWARWLNGLGLSVRLLPAQYVRAYVRRNKTDATDAAALLEAARAADIRPVRVKSVEQQALQGLHRIRSLWMGTRTSRINALRGFLREFGIAVPVGARTGLEAISRVLADPAQLESALLNLCINARDAMPGGGELVMLNGPFDAFARGDDIQARQLSMTDGLTGIANRRHFDEVLATEWQRAQRSRQRVHLACNGAGRCEQGMAGRGQAVVLLVRAGVLGLRLELQPAGFTEFLQLLVDLLVLGVPEVAEAILEALEQVVAAAGFAFQEDKDGVLERHGRVSPAAIEVRRSIRIMQKVAWPTNAA